MLRKPLFALFEDDERAILADVGTRKSIAGAGDVTTPQSLDPFQQPLHNRSDLAAGNQDIDFAAFGLAGVVTAGASREHIELLGHETPDIAPTCRGIHGDVGLQWMGVCGSHVIHSQMVGLHVVTIEMHCVGTVEHIGLGQGSDGNAKQP